MSPAPQVIPPFPYADLLSKGPYHDWRDDLARDGYVVVKGAIKRDRALELRAAAFDWLESFGRGFNRDDPATFGQDYLPMHNGRGMYSSYGFQQEQWVSSTFVRRRKSHSSVHKAASALGVAARRLSMAPAHYDAPALGDAQR